MIFDVFNYKSLCTEIMSKNCVIYENALTVNFLKIYPFGQFVLISIQELGSKTHFSILLKV